MCSLMSDIITLVNFSMDLFQISYKTAPIGNSLYTLFMKNIKKLCRAREIKTNLLSSTKSNIIFYYY